MTPKTVVYLTFVAYGLFAVGLGTAIGVVLCA